MSNNNSPAPRNTERDDLEKGSGDFPASQQASEPARVVAMGGAQLKPGQRLHDYQLLRHLGEGGAGQVWHAEHVYTGREVAIKVCTNLDLAETFANEARQLGRLMEAGHRRDFPASIVRLYETHVGHRPAFLVMEYMAGGDLRQLLLDKGALSEERVASIFASLLEALEFAHEMGIAHRDIKPENILLTEEGEVKVSDFGLGRAVAANLVSVHRSLATRRSTMSEFGGGTLEYMAPELLQPLRDGETHREREKSFAPTADIYALGVVLYELLVGERPRGLTLPTRRRPELNAAWDELFEGCYSHDPADRWQSIGAFRSAFEELLGARFPTLIKRRAGRSDAGRGETNREDSGIPEFGVRADGREPLRGRLRRILPKNRQGKKYRRRTADLKRVEQQARTLTPDEKLSRFFGYRFFGWVAPAAIWCYVVALSTTVAGRNPGSGLIVSLQGWNYALVAACCYFLYRLMARFDATPTLFRFGMSLAMLPLLPFMLLTIALSFSMLGPITPSIAILLHIALINDVSRKLRYPTPVHYTGKV